MLIISAGQYHANFTSLFLYYYITYAFDNNKWTVFQYISKLHSLSCAGLLFPYFSELIKVLYCGLLDWS